MSLNTIQNVPGARKKRKRVGCGIGSGHGKTSCRGHKGQKARSGGNIRPGFEGGQTPLYRRLPKKGFKNSRFKRGYQVINVEDLNNIENAIIDVETLLKSGLAKKKDVPIKILGNGDLTKKVTVRAHAFSEAARQKIEDKKGTWELL